MRIRLRETIRQTCEKLGIQIVKGLLSTDHEPLPPHTDGVSQAAETGIGADGIILQYLELHSQRELTGVRRSDAQRQKIGWHDLRFFQQGAGIMRGIV
jgi:hypothetical protein